MEIFMNLLVVERNFSNNKNDNALTVEIKFLMENNEHANYNKKLIKNTQNSTKSKKIF